MRRYIGAAAGVAALAATFAIGCTGVPLIGRARADADDVPGDLSATVLDDRVLAGATESLLTVMERNVPSLKVSASASCPALALRGPNTVPGLTDPRVYVDGTRALDTCILESLRAQDVRRVEIYPMGVTARAGYSPHSHGLILVFLREA